jgi:hypothetical protein
MIHKAVVLFIFPATCTKEFFLEGSYLFFMISSLLIIFALGKVKGSNIDYVGYAFLLLTFLKMAAAYAFFSGFFADVTEGRPSCKMNFFASFIVFLAIETYSTIKLLNNK